MKNKENRNIRVMAENNNSVEGFSIYIDFSGQREYLMHHRHNGLLYSYLKDSIVVDDMRRVKAAKIGGMARNKASALYKEVNYLVTVIDEYIEDRNEFKKGA